jgi:predicted RNase H-like HicB family nuclease
MSNEAIDRKFSKEDIQTAKELSRDYCIVIEKNDDLGFVGHCTEMPHVMNDGKTHEECRDNVIEAIRVVLAYMLEARIPIPQPQSTFNGDKAKSLKKVAGIEMWTEDMEHFYINNRSGSGNIWCSESIDVLKMVHTKLGEFIEEVEQCKK